MKRRLLALSVAVLLVLMSFAACTNITGAGKSNGAIQANARDGQIKNVIFMIPDGAGYPTYDFANDVKIAGGLNKTKFPNKTPTDNEPMTLRSYHRGSAITLNYQGRITDSAAAGTALSTGHKTINGRLGVDYAGRPVANILEAAQYVGKSTGLVATYEWMHATPAAFSSHALERSDYKNLYQQIENQGIDVVLGSGYGAVSIYATIQNAVDRGYKIIKTREDLKNVKPGDRIWGDATNDCSPYDINLTAEQPTLAEMTQAAITALSANEKGFFLMVEGSQVDSGGHSNNPLVTTSEYLAFDAAFKVAVDFAKGRTDTVVISLPDHDTGAMMYSDITDIDIAVRLIQNGLTSSQIDWETTDHSDQNVGVWMYVPEGVELVEGLSPVAGDTPENRIDYVVQNSVFAPYVASLFGVDLAKLTEELFVDVTDYGRYSESVGKFSFNNGDKYVYRNQSVYYKNGEEISLDGMVAVQIDGKFYVPKVMIDEDDFKYLNEEGSNEITGSGTAEDPYIIDETWDFIEFSGNLVLGETYEGKYFLQTKDIDLSTSSDFVGLGLNQNFAGIYNGGGNTIRVDLEVENDESVFPKVTGTLVNVKTSGRIVSLGTIQGSSRPSGISRLIAKNGKMINCSSDVQLEGLSAGGLVGANNGLIMNCFFGGSIKAGDKAAALAPITFDGTFENCYYISSCGAEQPDEGVWSVDGNSEDIINKLSEYAKNCAEVLDVSESYINPWTMSENGAPEIYVPIPIVEKVVVTPNTVSLKKGDGIQLEAVVEGKFNPPGEINWSIESSSGKSLSVIYEDGFLRIDENETAENFTIIAKSAFDGSVSDICKVTVENEVATEVDGSRARPYKINNEEEFLAFTNAIIEGKTLSGLYFELKSDLDMSAVEEYNGIPNSGTFAGVFDGKGHEIILDIESVDDNDNALFGSCTGVIMNVITSGTVKGVARPSGIVRAIRENGVLINCISYCEIISDDDASGLVRSNYNLVANSVFGGTLTGLTKFPVCCVQTDAVSFNNYAVGEEYYVNSELTSVIQEQLMSDEYVAKLNDGRVKAAKLAGVPVSFLCDWELSEEGKIKLKK